MRAFNHAGRWLRLVILFYIMSFRTRKDGSHYPLKSGASIDSYRAMKMQDKKRVSSQGHASKEEVAKWWFNLDYYGKLDAQRLAGVGTGTTSAYFNDPLLQLQSEYVEGIVKFYKELQAGKIKAIKNRGTTTFTRA